MLSAPVFRISGIQDVMPGPSISAGRGQGAKDLRGISPITGKGNGQGGSHVQRKYPGIDFHRARILMPGQCLDDLPGLPVIKHVHDIAVPESMRRYRNRKMHAVSFSPLHRLFQRHCCKVSDEAAFCLIQRPYISKTLLTRRISPRGSP